MFPIAVLATGVAVVQNIVMFTFGLKEGAIFAFPLAFAGVFLAEIAAIWGGYFSIRRRLRARRGLALTAWAIAILGAAELALPQSTFAVGARHSIRMRVLNRIEVAGTSIEPLASEGNGSRFALTYTLRFPKTAPYLTFPAWLGRSQDNIFGDYFTKEHPEYHDENHVFSAGQPYAFTVIFDTKGQRVDFLTEHANIDICDGKDYFMACRVIAIGLEGVPAALAARPAPVRREPAVPEDNPRDIAEKHIRLAKLTMKGPVSKAGEPVGFSFVITNTGEKDIVISGSDFGNVVAVSYAWEPLSDSARRTKVIPGTMRFGNAVAAGGAQFTSGRNSNLSPGEQVSFEDKINPFEPFVPGEYRLHVYLFSRYATATNTPVQELVQNFSVGP